MSWKVRFFDLFKFGHKKSAGFIAGAFALVLYLNIYPDFI